MASNNGVVHSTNSSTLADVLEMVLDKGIVIAGDISISLADVELLTIKIRLVVASVEKAMEMGIDWWKKDPALSSMAQRQERLGEGEILKRLEAIENKLEGAKIEAKI
ncbi:gas vesicle protein [Marinisporobacter balticus]|uniref:Gas vesicle protein GvpA/GvpJ/GvpM family n=1 Tax=Marinisporobacter balticus TaxID=2018667 RepID=A0A4V2SBZ1_9FIRM|nr:gas vesicle protein [Marinisporobacter balticus]TCO77360.1 gas vesicle protein GvpA/GvpJ/GvpM family [Marinisporobacter balticus]